jgi:hypothetical protein
MPNDILGELDHLTFVTKEIKMITSVKKNELIQIIHEPCKEDYKFVPKIELFVFFFSS